MSDDENMQWESSGGSHAEAQDEFQVTVSFKWFESSPPQKPKKMLEMALQSWANSRRFNGNCEVSDNIQDNVKAKIKIKPAPDVWDLQDLCGKTLKVKDKETVTILSVTLSPPESETQMTDKASEPQKGAGQLLEQHEDMTTNVHPQPEKESAEDTSSTPPSSSGSKSQDERPAKQSSINGPAADSTAGEETDTGILPVSQFMYMNNLYKKEISDILKKNRTTMKTEALVTFSEGNSCQALQEFTELLRKVEYCGSDSTINNRNPKELMDALQIVLTKESKLMLTLSSEEIVICGPSQSQDAIKKSLKIKDVNSSAEESSAAPQDTPPNIDMNINDPFLKTGLIFEENHWKLMGTSFYQELKNIEDKFGVEIKASEIGQGKVNIKTFHKRSGGNPSMESHALRALLRLYQKIITSPFNFIQPHGAAGYNGSLKNFNDADESEGASGGPESNGKSGYNIRYPDPPQKEGATAAENKDETCPICMDTFFNKTQLKCKHEFCKRCLEQSKESMGPMCPVCKHVFGKIEGDQPPGRMRSMSYGTSLPGFPDCGHIVITYDIPGGSQTEKHPNPGQYYHGITRIAYLPDNREGKEVLHLLKKAFDQKLIFTVGTSRTTGAENQVTWNDIHHKTSKTGGTTGFGYPDPHYLSRVKEELKAKGVE